jgi:hypothetical protein
MPPVSNQWLVRRESSAIEGRPPKVELSRIYKFPGTQSTDSTMMLGLVCTFVSEGLAIGSSSEPSRLNINRRLRVIFRPLRLSRKTLATLELFAMDRSEGGKFHVFATPVGRDDATLFAEIAVSREDAATIVNTIMSGKTMTFKLACEAVPPLQFYLQNDLEFKRLCDETYRQFVELEFAYHKRLLKSASL